MKYRENPKTAGSGVRCAIPQSTKCPVNCKDCFFQSGRSYLEPMEKNLPNLPPVDGKLRIVRVNDGNDSNIDKELVEERTEQYPSRFFNTSYAKRLDEFPGPVVLTVNPQRHTDVVPEYVDHPPPNLMFVRVRTNMWNLERVVDRAVQFYTEREVPVVLTFMAYHKEETIPPEYRKYYTLRERTTNPYFAITTLAWKTVMDRYFPNLLVYSCGRIEGELGDTHCKYCGNCLREFFATIVRMGQ